MALRWIAPIPFVSGCARFITRIFLAIVIYANCLATAEAQQSTSRAPAKPVRLSAVISAFLVDSGVMTRGLAWTTAGTLPIKWESSTPVTNTDASERQRGVTLMRKGSFSGTIGDSVVLPMTIRLTGTVTGLAGMMINIPSMLVTQKKSGGFFMTREMVEQSLKNEGLTLVPLKCSRDREGASYGNLVDAVKAPGKTASGLWWYWDSPKQEMFLSLTLLYRRVDMAQVECFSG